MFFEDTALARNVVVADGIEPSSIGYQPTVLAVVLCHNCLATVLRIELSLVVLEATFFPEEHRYYLEAGAGFEPAISSL